MQSEKSQPEEILLINLGMDKGMHEITIDFYVPNLNGKNTTSLI